MHPAGARGREREKEAQPAPRLEPEIELAIDRLLDPVVGIIRHYRAHDFERRALFFAWLANIFKPVAAIEVSKILGYDYRRVDHLFRTLDQSGFLVEVTNEADYRRVIPGPIPLYIRRDSLGGRRLTGRPPKMYLFSERESINVEAFVDSFNSDGAKIWGHMISKAVKLAESLDESYQDALVDDVLFLCDRIAPIFRFLRKEGIIVYERHASETSIKLKLPRSSARYNVPDLEPFKRLL